MSVTNLLPLFAALVLVPLAALWPRGPRRLRALRALTVLALCVAAAEPYRISTTERSSLLALVDVSDSMDKTAGNALVERLSQFKRSNRELSIVPFAGKATNRSLALGDIGSFSRLKESWEQLDVGSTDLEKAITTAPIPPGSNVLLLSDGFETAGAIERGLSALSARGTRIYPLALSQSEGTPEQFRISNLHAPLLAPAQKSVDVRVSVQNTTKTAQRGTLEVRHDGKVVLQKQVEIAPGSEAVEIAPSDPTKEGIKEITATLTPANHTYGQSEETIYLSGQAREKVLLVSGSGEDSRILEPVLKGQSYQLTSLVADQGVGSLPDLSQFSTILFNNVGANQLPRSALPEIKRYVENGGGFVMIGGNRSFGLGGYIGTAIEDVLPVEMVPPHTEKKRLNVAVELVMDKSRSMASDNKLEYAKEAARQSIQSLKDDDYLGVIGFDKDPFVALPLTQLSRGRDLAMDRISRLFPSGATNPLPAIELGRNSLTHTNAGRKHMIVLTDGEIPNAGPYYIELVRQMRLEGITVSTVMLGGEADVSMLRSMSEVGGGSFYQTLNALNLPKIFVSDIKVSTGERTLKEEQEFPVRVTENRKSTSITNFPPLLGYVETKQRPRADLEAVVMESDKAEPLLASWSLGKGRAIAFTSDANGRWSGYWSRWPRFQSFWSEIVEKSRPSSTAGESIPFDLRYTVDRGALALELTVFKEGVSGAVQAELVKPDGSVASVSFSPAAPGRFAARVEHVKAGKYELRAKIGSRSLTPVAFRLPGSLFGERMGQGFNLPALQHIASATGGIVNPDPSLLEERPTIIEERSPLSHYALMLAAILLLLSIMTREGMVPNARALRIGRRRGVKAAASAR